MSKILPFHKISSFSRNLSLNSQATVLVGGCFDILHGGHITFLEKSHEYGDHLIVLLESDEAIAANKGDGLPINSQIDRAQILASLSCVDTVLLLPYFQHHKEYFELVNQLKPDIIGVTCGDPILVLKRSYAESVGGRLVEVMNRMPGYSTSKIIERAQNL